jgi:Fe-S-cluster-containing dehydrogenase component
MSMEIVTTCHVTKPGCAVTEETVARLKRGDLSVLAPDDGELEQTPMVLAVDPQKCNGCKLCETACSLYNYREVDVSRSRIRVLEWNTEGVFLPVFCQHCADAPCRAACPKDAISWLDDWGRVVIDYDRCVSCRMCLAACPFGAISFDRFRQVVFKCDLCGGRPQCVSFCEPGALTFTHADRVPYSVIRRAADVMRRY